LKEKGEEGVLKISFDDINEARNLFGPRDENIRYLRRYFKVKTSVRGNYLTIAGDKHELEDTNKVINHSII
jgi:phosphate starvation-inducible protein PhoH